MRESPLGLFSSLCIGIGYGYMSLYATLMALYATLVSLYATCLWYLLTEIDLHYQVFNLYEQAFFISVLLWFLHNGSSQFGERLGEERFILAAYY